MADTKIVTVRQAETPQEVNDALASLKKACSAWPTVQKEVPVSGAPLTRTEPPSSNDQIIMCDLVVNPTEVVHDAMWHTAVMSSVATLLTLVVLWAAWRATKGMWGFSKFAWHAFKAIRFHG